MSVRASTATAILIAGPTASGKSALAMALAERLGGVIINADSMQVYRELRILTARPSIEDEARVPHRLFGHVPAAEAYSVGQYLRDAAAAIRAVRDDGRAPVIVGGTGLYFKALLDGLSPIPEIRPEVRMHWRAEAARLGAAALHAELAARDPEMAARLNPTDPQRVTRALEVLESSGRSLAYWQSLPGEPVLVEAETTRYVVAPDRDELYSRCDARLDAMIAGGALAEVEDLMRQRLPADLPAMRALGVAPLAAHLTGLLALEDAIARAKQDTRQYAKRQLTWLRGNMCAWKAVDAQLYDDLLRQS